MTFVRITSDDGTVTGVKNNGSIWKTHMISADCEHPEAAIMMINSYTWMINDLTDFAYRDTFLGTYLTPGSVTLNNPLADYNQAVLIAAAQDTRDTTGMDPDVLAKYEKLPESFEEACEAAASSEFIKKHIPERILSIYCGR